MNRLLERLLRKYLNIHSEEEIPKELNKFIMSCNIAFDDLIIQRARAQHSLALVSDELLEKNEEIEKNKDKIEKLLFNILPHTIIDRVLNQEKVIADTVSNTDIMFADIANFTKISTKIGVAQTVSFLNEVFTQFDTIIYKHNIKKVKTVGDCYMASTRLVEQEEKCHIDNIIYSSQEMIRQFLQVCHAYDINTKLRIGVNSGPVIAGVIGQSIFSYDLWGNTVNIASRMEKTGIGNSIQVTKKTYKLLSKEIQKQFKARGHTQIKGKGKIYTYLNKVKLL